MSTIQIINKHSGEITDTYVDIGSENYDIGAKTIILQAGKGKTTIQFDDSVELQLLEGAEDLEVDGKGGDVFDYPTG